MGQILEGTEEKSVLTMKGFPCKFSLKAFQSEEDESQTAEATVIFYRIAS